MTKDGKEKWVEQIGSLISEGDEIVGLQFIVRDISGRKNAEEALLTSEQRYRALFELNQDAVYLLDTEGHYLAVNQNGAEILGYSPEELIGRSMEINIPPDELGNSRLQLETLLAGETLPIYQRTFMRRDGTEFPVEVTIALVRDSDGEPLHIQSIVRDISERVAADKSLQSNLNRTQGLYQISRSTTSFNNIPDLIHSIADNVADALSAEQVLIITMDHVKEEVVHYGIGGPKAADLEKDTYDQLMDGLTGWVIENQEPALSPHGADDKRESIDNQKRRKKSGGPALLVLPLTYRGRSLGTITAIRHPENQDFSQEDLKLVETVSDHLSTTIQNVILFDKIQANSERLQEVDRLKSQFLANMSHEIRTPLNAIIGMTDLVFETKLDETQQEYLEIIQSSGDLLLSTINDIIDFSQIEAGKLVIEDTQMSLEEEIDKTINMLSFKAAEKDLELGFSISSNVPKQIVSDPHRLRQILVNLVGNSIKFTESGSISVEVDSVILENEILEIKFAVRDTGVGIPEDRKDILFEPFKQVDSSIRRRHGGSGLGLAISKQLCELMQGRIWVDSQEGEGSTFLFTILCNPADPENEMLGNLTTDDFPSLGDKRPLEILLAEDSIVNQKVAMYSLQRLGYQVDVVDNGHQVLEALKKKAYDVIMMDIQMPGMDGIEATRHIRKNLPPNQQPRIIALTAHAMSEDRERCLEAGMDDYVEKPFKIERLVQALGASKIVEV